MVAYWTPLSILWIRVTFYLLIIEQVVHFYSAILGSAPPSTGAVLHCYLQLSILAFRNAFSKAGGISFVILFREGRIDCPHRPNTKYLVGFLFMHSL